MNPSIEQERQESQAWMREFTNKMLRGLKIVELQSVRYRDTYSGSAAYIIFNASFELMRITFKVEIASEDDDIFISGFPAQNTVKDENDGFVGSPEEFRKTVRSSEFRHSYIKAMFTGRWTFFKVERTKVLPRQSQ